MLEVTNPFLTPCLVSPYYPTELPLTLISGYTGSKWWGGKGTFLLGYQESKQSSRPELQPKGRQDHSLPQSRFNFNRAHVSCLFSYRHWTHSSDFSPFPSVSKAEEWFPVFPNFKIYQSQEYSTTSDSTRFLDPLISLFTTPPGPSLSFQKDSHGTQGLEEG